MILPDGLVFPKIRAAQDKRALKSENAIRKHIACDMLAPSAVAFRQHHSFRASAPPRGAFYFIGNAKQFPMK